MAAFVVLLIPVTSLPSHPCSIASCCHLGRSGCGWMPLLHLHRQKLQQMLRRPPCRTGEGWPSQALSPAALASLWRPRWASHRRSAGTSLPWATATTGAWARRSAERSQRPCSRRSCELLREAPLCLRAVRGRPPTASARSGSCAHPPRHLGCVSPFRRGAGTAAYKPSRGYTCTTTCLIQAEREQEQEQEQEPDGCAVVVGRPLTRECREQQVRVGVRVRVRVRVRVVRVRVRFRVRVRVRVRVR